ncbi:hypothetical protein ACFLZP_02500 [Patescibacteria group bacterium]
MTYQLVPIKKKKTTLADHLRDLPDEELIKQYEQTRIWLVKHEAKTGTQNLLDESNQRYNPKKYSPKLKLLEKIADEAEEREIALFPANEELEMIFGASYADKQVHPLSVSNQEGEKP